MNTRQNYDPNRAKQTPIEPTARPNDCFNPAHPWQILYAVDTSHPEGLSYYVPSELELIVTALELHRRDLIGQTGCDGVNEQIEIIDGTLEELRGLAFEGLALRSAYIHSLTRK